MTSGWFDRFKKRKNLQIIRITGEVAVQMYNPNNNYSPELVFNVTILLCFGRESCFFYHTKKNDYYILIQLNKGKFFLGGNAKVDI